MPERGRKDGQHAGKHPLRREESGREDREEAGRVWAEPEASAHAKGRATGIHGRVWGAGEGVGEALRAVPGQVSYTVLPGAAAGWVQSEWAGEVRGNG